jgi:hypothetical protein
VKRLELEEKLGSVIPLAKVDGIIKRIVYTAKGQIEPIPEIVYHRLDGVGEEQRAAIKREVQQIVNDALATIAAGLKEAISTKDED